jgi:diacylglycerol O-acyltransferase
VSREYLSRIDTTLLQLEDPTNPMMITLVMGFKEPIHVDRLKATLEARLLAMPRFRQRVAWSRLVLGRPYWRDDPDFDLNYHLQHATLPPPGDKAVLQDAVGLLASTPLDMTKPLWQFHLLENYAECCALVIRCHHSVVDGIAMVHVLLSLTDFDPDPPWPAPKPTCARRRSRDWPRPRLTAARSVERAGRQATKAILQAGLTLVAHPSHARALGKASTKVATEAAKIVGRFALLEPDPDTVLSGKLGTSKCAAWSKEMPLEDIKIIRRRLGGTVNDVLLTAVTGALRRYLQDQGEPVDAINLRAAVPVNLRTPGKEAELGNRMGAVFLPLPVSIAHPAVRLGEIQRMMNDRKGSLEAPVFFFLLNALGYVPPTISKPLVDTFGTRGTAIITNVRGPETRLYLAGAPLELLMGWVPQTGPLGVGVSILSYAGQIRVGVLSDKGLMPDPEVLLAKFHEEYAALLALADQVETDAALDGTVAVPDDALESLDTTPEADLALVSGTVADAPSQTEEPLT